MPGQPRQLLVVAGPAGRSFAVSDLGDAGRLAADDLVEGRRLGELYGDLMPFLVTVDGAQFILCAGAVHGMGVDIVELTSPGFSKVHQVCRVKNDVWMSFPEPFVEGMVITATWRDGDRVLFTRQAELTSNALEPIFGPGWKFYAPLEE